MTRVTVIGGGQGGATVAHQLRAGGFDGGITLVSSRRHLPYERPPLSKGVLEPDMQPVLVLPESFYADSDIELRLDEPVLRIKEDLTVVTKTSAIPSTHVVLATGSTPRRLRFTGDDLTGIVSLHSLDDARYVGKHATSDARVVIVGGGLIGSEMAAALASRVHSVVIVDLAGSPMAAKVGPRVAGRLEEAQRAAGIEFRQTGVDRFEGGTRVERVVCADGQTLPADLVILGLGAVPCLDVARDSGLDITSGVTVDRLGRTSRPGVYAVGDIAEWPYDHLGAIRAEHYRAAVDQGTVVAGAIMGMEFARPIVPWFWTEQFADRIEVVGRPALGERCISPGEVTGEDYTEFYMVHDRLVGAIGVNAPRQIRTAGQRIAQGAVLDPAAVAIGDLKPRRNNS